MIKIHEDLETMYGGLPSLGGFSRRNEYELAFGKFAEACHCVLGSLHQTRYWYMRYKNDGNQDMINNGDYYQNEIGHIEEEISIVEKTIDIYQKDLYIDIFNRDSDSNQMEDLINQARELNKIASDSKKKLMSQSEYPTKMRDLSYYALNSVIVLTELVEDSMRREFPLSYSDNIFKNDNLEMKVYMMRKTFEEILDRYDF